MTEQIGAYAFSPIRRQILRRTYLKDFVLGSICPAQVGLRVVKAECALGKDPLLLHSAVSH